MFVPKMETAGMDRSETRPKVFAVRVMEIAAA
jgi:hypothetical protein